MCNNHNTEHKHNEECLIKINLPKNKVDIKETITNKDIQLIEVVEILVEVVEKSEEVRQEKRKKLLVKSKEDINEILKYKRYPIEMTSECIGTKENANFHCLDPECDHRWNAIVSNVVYRGPGCWECYKRFRFTNYVPNRSKEQINEELSREGRFLYMRGEYKGAHVPTEFWCLVCGKKWSPRPQDIYGKRKEDVVIVPITSLYLTTL